MLETCVPVCLNSNLLCETPFLQRDGVIHFTYSYPAACNLAWWRWGFKQSWDLYSLLKLQVSLSDNLHYISDIPLCSCSQLPWRSFELTFCAPLQSCWQLPDVLVLTSTEAFRIILLPPAKNKKEIILHSHVNSFRSASSIPQPWPDIHLCWNSGYCTSSRTPNPHHPRKKYSPGFFFFSSPLYSPDWEVYSISFSYADQTTYCFRYLGKIF